jgi:hypothetical protein
MRRFGGIFRHEFGMSIRRRGLWIAYGLLFLFHTVLLFAPPPVGEWVDGEVITRAGLWPAADRVQRDFRTGVHELQVSTPLGTTTYVLAKYVAALASCLVPLFAWLMAVALVMTGVGHAIVNDPRVLIVDVPTAVLDPEERIRFRGSPAALTEAAAGHLWTVTSARLEDGYVWLMR